MAEGNLAGVWGDYMSFGDLTLTLGHEGQIIAEMSGPPPALAGIQAEVLLLGGSNSSAFLKQALDRAEAMMPRTRRVTLDGLNHSSPWNTDLRGKPGPIADQLRQFFATTDPT